MGSQPTGHDWKFYFCVCGGTAAGVFLFLVGAVLFVGDPLGDWFMSAHAILVGEKQKELSVAGKAMLYYLSSSGVVISTDELMSQITTFYGNLIQTLVEIFFVFGFISFFILRWQSRQIMEDAVAAAVQSGLSNYTGSLHFDGVVTAKVQNVASTELEDLEGRISVIGVLDERVSVLEESISSSDDADKTLSAARRSAAPSVRPRSKKMGSK